MIGAGVEHCRSTENGSRCQSGSLVATCGGLLLKAVSQAGLPALKVTMVPRYYPNNGESHNGT